MFHGVIHKITLAQFFWDTVYIRTSNLVGVFTGSIRTKVH